MKFGSQLLDIVAIDDYDFKNIFEKISKKSNNYIKK